MRIRLCADEHLTFCTHCQLKEMGFNEKLGSESHIGKSEK